jgi:neuroligin
VRGILIQPNSRQMEVVEAFLGIPYASPPTGSSRYRFPKAPVKWSGVRTAEKFGAVCPQRLPDLANETATLELMPPGRLNQVRRLAPLLANQSEDCLNLNLYVPGSGKCILRVLMFRDFHCAQLICPARASAYQIWRQRAPHTR